MCYVIARVMFQDDFCITEKYFFFSTFMKVIVQRAS